MVVRVILRCVMLLSSRPVLTLAYASDISYKLSDNELYLYSYGYLMRPALNILHTAFNTQYRSLSAVPVASKNAQKRLFELLISERVAEWIKGAVKVTQPVRDVINDWLDARQTEAHDH